MTFAQHVLQFTQTLQPNLQLPPGFDLLFPYNNPETRRVMMAFYEKYYKDSNPRIFIFGINPGRFGAGVTGVPFTDPIRLESECGIANDFAKKPELSSVFVYQFIQAYGGLELFYKNFYITSLSPLGFTKNGININYYDDKNLQKTVEPFIIQSIQMQQQFGTTRRVALCMGQGQNATYFQKINEQHRFFEQIIALPHPRWVTQYRQKSVAELVQVYVKQLVRAEEMAAEDSDKF